jgi:hypothetical protein
VGSSLPAVTIASNNYLAMARVWAESYREHHPDAAVFLCVVDEPSPEVDYEAFPARVIFARDLPIPAFRNFAFRYDVLELNTAVKPTLLAHLRDTCGLDRVLYFDPDILVLDRLTGLEAILERHSLALTPHVTGPLDDRRNPGERKIRMVGVYNLGFLGLRLDESTRGFLTWWSEKLFRFCRNDPWSGLFVDQAWMDLAPAYLDGVAVLREPIYNVAYWNLPQREVRRKGGRWLANGRPIGFFHFSGIDFTDLDQVSRHQDRVAPGECPEVRPLFEDYRRRVEAAGHPAQRRLPYAYGRFSDDGPAIPAFARQTLQRLDPWGRRFTDPFDRSATDSFFAYLAEPLVFPLGAANRALLALWEARPDLQRHFPDPVGHDLPAFRDWLAGHGPGCPDVPAEWLAGVAPAPGAVTVLPGAVAEPAPADLRPPRTRELLNQIDLTIAGPLTPWLNEPVLGTARPRPVLTRLALLLHEARPDLEAAFPDPLGRDQRAYALWFSRHAAAEEKLHPELVRPITDSLPRFRPRATPRPRLTLPAPVANAADSPPPTSFESRGVRGAGSPLQGPRGLNLVGPLGDQGALGQWLRGMRELAQRAGWPLAELDVADDAWGQQVGGLGQPAAGVPYGLTLVAAAAAEARATLGRVPAPRVADGGLIGLWSWDYDWFPPDRAYWSVFFDELWVPSGAVARALAPVVDLTVRVVPPWLGAPAEPAPRTELGTAGAEGRFAFVAPFEGRDEEAERNDLDVLLAAFGSLGEGERARVGLCLAATGARPGERRATEIEERLRGLPAMLSLDPARTPALIAAGDGVVTLPRADGSGLDAARAALAGKPLVAPAVGALADWLTPETGWPVAGRPVRIGHWRGAAAPTVVWTEVAPEAVAAALLAVVADPEAAIRRAERARARVEELHGAGAVARIGAELARLGGRFPS